MRFRPTCPLLLGSLLLTQCGSVANKEHSQPSEQAQQQLVQQSQAEDFFVVLDGPSAAALIPKGASVKDPAVRALTSKRVQTLEAEHAIIKGLVEATGATITAEFTRLANALQVRATTDQVALLQRLPNVVRVEKVAVVKRSMITAGPLIGAYDAWGSPTTPATGKNVRVGIVDTGVDYLHADFGGPGTQDAYVANDRTTIEPGSFPTSKVVGGVDLVGDDYDGTNSRQQDDDPLDCAGMQSMTIEGGHGTHVAGIAAGQGVLLDGSSFAGPYNASVSPAQFRVGPGIAPEAEIYAIKVFGCTGSTAFSDLGFEWASDPDRDGDFSDHLDVVNASLGSEFGQGAATSAQVVANLANVGTTLVVAAGNSGETFFITGSPAVYTEAIAVAATTDQASFLALNVDTPASIAGEYPTVEGAFTKPLAQVGVISAEVVVTSPADACAPLANASEVAGKIALIQRKPCPFVDKLANAAAAGAVAAIVTDNELAQYPLAMGGDTEVAIPGVFLTQSDGQVIRDVISAGQTVTVTLDPNDLYDVSVGADQIAGFSSRGPRISDLRLKPDLAAPGQGIDSAGVATGNRPVQLSGTSMACPMMAGAAALVREAHPSFTPYDVKAALMNNVKRVDDGVGNYAPLSWVGSGRTRVDLAVSRDVVAFASEPAGAVSVSFGAITPSSTTNKTQQISVANHGSSEVTLTLSIESQRELSGVTLQYPNQLTVAAGATATFDLTLVVDPAQLPPPTPDAFTEPVRSFGNQQLPRHYMIEAAGHVVLTPPNVSNADAIRVPYYSVVRAGDEQQINEVSGCADSNQSVITLTTTGLTTNPEPVLSVFELIAEDPLYDPPKPGLEYTDLRAIGAASNFSTVADPADAFLYLALAVEGEWITPAHGEPKQTGYLAEIDITDDKIPDFFVGIEPVADVFRVYTYPSLAVGGGDRGRSYLNLVSAAERRTEPFNNSVLILPVSIDFLALPEGQTSVKFRVASQAPNETGFMSRPDVSDWFSYDFGNPKIDTAKLGTNGVPIFGKDETISVAINDNTVPLPDLLVLHHTNVLGKRYQVVSLAAAASIDTAVTASPATLTTPSGSVEFTVTSPADLTNATLTFGVDQASIDSIEVSQGTCQISPPSCEIGSLTAGQSVLLTVNVNSDAASGSITATLSAGNGCDPQPANNTVTVAINANGGSGGSGGSSGGTAGSANAGTAGTTGAGASAAAGGSGGSTGGTAGATGGTTPELVPASAAGGCNCGVESKAQTGWGLASALAGLFAFASRRKKQRREVSAQR